MSVSLLLLTLIDLSFGKLIVDRASVAANDIQQSEHPMDLETIQPHDMLISYGSNGEVQYKIRYGDIEAKETRVTKNG